MRLSAFAKDLAGILFGRSERRFAKDVLRELGIEPDLLDRLQVESETKMKNQIESRDRNA